jgi:hypothetical protein
VYSSFSPAFSGVFQERAHAARRARTHPRTRSAAIRFQGVQATVHAFVRLNISPEHGFAKSRYITW